MRLSWAGYAEKTWGAEKCVQDFSRKLPVEENTLEGRLNRMIIVIKSGLIGTG